jgi:K+-transporting ATPase KdpF subunit
LREIVGGSMETIVVGIIAFLLFIYLFVAVIRPEKF